MFSPCSEGLLIHLRYPGQGNLSEIVSSPSPFQEQREDEGVFGQGFRLVVVAVRIAFPAGDDGALGPGVVEKADGAAAEGAQRVARKSSIYKGRVSFALFGIGDYAFAPWKVAVSGLHRSGRFQVVGPMHGQPMFFDDASYYLPFAREEEARLVSDILNSPLCQRFLAALVFPDSKRPFTVDLLQRLNLAVIADEAGLGPRWQQLQRANYAFSAEVPQFEFVMESPKPAG